MKLKLLSVDQELIHVECSETITLVDIQEQDPLSTLLGPNCTKSGILVDMSKTTYIDSAAVSWLIRWNRSCYEQGGCFVIYSISPMVMKVLQLLRMDKVLHLATDEAHARKIAQGAKP